MVPPIKKISIKSMKLIYNSYAFHLAHFRYYFHQIFSIRSIHYSSSVFRDKHNMVGAIPASMLYTLIVHMDTSCVMLWLRTNNILTQEVYFFYSGQRYGFASSPISDGGLPFSSINASSSTTSQLPLQARSQRPASLPEGLSARLTSAPVYESCRRCRHPQIPCAC